MDSKEMLDNLKLDGQAFSFDILSILKIPVILVILGNILFSTLLFLRVRILADTFKTPQNTIVKQIVALHIIMIIVGTLLSLLFVILL
jgi:predicted membrane protein